MNKTAALIGLGVGIGLLVGLILGGAMADKPQEKKGVSSLNVTTYIEPYTGVGSGVLKHGTIIRGDYKGPESIVGHFNEGTEDEFPGTWVIRKVVTE